MRALLLCLVISATMILVPGSAQTLPSDELFVPILINGPTGESSHYQTVFRFVELSGTTASPAVTVQTDVYDNAGNQIAPLQLFCSPPSFPPLPYPVQRKLNGSGSVHFGTSGLVADQPNLLIDGWARLTVTGPGKLQATAEVFHVAVAPAGCTVPVPICTRPSDLYTSDAVVYAVRPAKAFRAAAVITPYRHTAFSVVNPSGSETAHVFFKLFNPEGEGLWGFTFAIPPMQRRSAFAWEWANPLPEGTIGVPIPVPEDFYGSAKIVSDVPVAVGALQVLLPEGKIVSALVTPEP